MPDQDTDTPTTASPGGDDSPPGLSGQSTPSPAPAGQGAPPPTPTAQPPQGNMQPGLLAYGRHLMGVAVQNMDMAIRVLPSGEDRELVMKHFAALSKRFKSQSPLQQGGGQGAGGPGPIGVPRPPGAGNPTAQPGTPNLPRGPIPMPQAPGGLAG